MSICLVLLCAPCGVVRVRGYSYPFAFGIAGRMVASHGASASMVCAAAANQLRRGFEASKACELKQACALLKNDMDMCAQPRASWLCPACGAGTQPAPGFPVRGFACSPAACGHLRCPWACVPTCTCTRMHAQTQAHALAHGAPAVAMAASMVCSCIP